MGKTAFLFPGQGSQRVGMGADLLEQRPELFESYMEQVQTASGLPIRTLCLEGPIEDLTRTEVAQPALFTVSLMVAELAREADLKPDFVAGHSLGEYTAAVVCGALSVEQGMRLVSKRGQLMAAAQSDIPGAMAAIIGLPAERVAELCASVGDGTTVAPANLNTPTQIVVSGEEDAVVQLLALAEQAGADKAIRLQVGAAFHSHLMKPVQSELRETMAGMSFEDPDVPMVSNASAAIVNSGDEIRQALIAQIASPVLWMDCVHTLVDAGCDSFLELGSGRVLGGLVRQTAPDVETFTADSPKKLAKFISRNEAAQADA